MEDLKKPQSEFNAGIAKLQRIDKYRLGIHQARIESKYNDWFKCLLSWRSEINERLTSEEIKRANQFQTNILVTLNSGSSEADLIKQLQSYELFLGTMEHKYGLGLRDQKSMSDAISDME